MKKILLSVLISASFLITNAQQKQWKRYLLTGSSMFVSGMLDGTVESISYHYENGFKLRVKNANDQFWNPALSWKNKYKNGNCELGPKFMGSTTYLACTTDAYHMLRTAKRSIDGLTLAYYVNENCIHRKTSRKQVWKRTLKDFAILTAIRCVGFHTTYSLLFRRQNT